MSLLLLRLLRRYFASSLRAPRFGGLQVHSSIRPFSERSEGKSTERRIWRGESTDAEWWRHIKTPPSGTVTPQWRIFLSSLKGSSTVIQKCVFPFIYIHDNLVHVLCHHFIILLSFCSYDSYDHISLSCFWFRLQLKVHSATFAVHAVPWKRRGCRCQVFTCHWFKVLIFLFISVIVSLKRDEIHEHKAALSANTEKSPKHKSWSWGLDDNN